MMLMRYEINFYLTGQFEKQNNICTNNHHSRTVTTENFHDEDGNETDLC